ncbi:MAG TPA: ATP-binding protein [Nocardioidaceae bacterium]|nr:ATP-binding protein [Nocardioidaceae bacterium]
MMEDAFPWTHVKELPPQGSSSAEARHFVGARLVEHALVDLVGDVTLVVSELATNATLHAGTPFTVSVRGEDRHVVVSVRDTSPWVPAVIPSDALSLSGRGLAIVQHFSHDWGVSQGADGAKSVWASFEVDSGR